MRPSPGSAPTYRYIGATAKSRDGWDSLGDLGYFDADGFLYLNDRRVDMFTVGGRNVYPAEIESALSRPPGCVVLLGGWRARRGPGSGAARHRAGRRARRGGRHAFLSERIAVVQGAAHRRVQRHPAARRRGQGAPVGGARRGHRATGSGTFLTALSSGGTGSFRRGTPSAAARLGTATRPARSSPPRSRSRTPPSAPAPPAYAR